jgi:alkanesulfonate monooxygenase SsuD/methylene tetrahydromethanopterin reductase-like flavin-dependent oxidoreductase (luciferase family)
METVIRFDMRAPSFGTPMPELYRAALEMAQFADDRGIDVIMLTEHHGSADGYLPAPTVLAGGFAARSSRARIRLGAVVLPLHDPVEVAEQVLVLDQMSGGRVEVVVGAGYVPSEFAMFGRSLRERPSLLEKRLPILSDALAGRPVTVDGHTFTVTPTPLQQPRPPLLVAGGVPAAARRAAVYGDGFYPFNADPELRELYRLECRRVGKPVGPIIDTTGSMFVHVARDPEEAWSRIGPHALYELNSYGQWAADSVGGDLRSPYHVVEDVAAARACGMYSVVTVEGCLEMMDRFAAEGRSLVLTPLLAGLSPETAWSSLHLFLDEVLPRYRAARSESRAAPVVAP